MLTRLALSGEQMAETKFTELIDALVSLPCAQGYLWPSTARPVGLLYSLLFSHININIILGNLYF